MNERGSMTGSKIRKFLLFLLFSSIIFFCHFHPFPFLQVTFLRIPVQVLRCLYVYSEPSLRSLCVQSGLSSMGLWKGDLQAVSGGSLGGEFQRVSGQSPRGLSRSLGGLQDHPGSIRQDYKKLGSVSPFLGIPEHISGNISDSLKTIHGKQESSHPASLAFLTFLSLSSI